MNDAPIVKDTRKIRSEISHQFGNSIEKYMASLRTAKHQGKATTPSCVKEEHSGYSTSV